MSAVLDSGSAIAPAQRSPGVWVAAWRRLKEDKVGLGSLAVVLAFFVLILASTLGLVAGDWQVENGLHYVKDRWWDEDRHYSKRPGMALGFAVLLNAVVTVLRAAGDPEDDRPLRARADSLRWDVEQAISLIAGKKL